LNDEIVEKSREPMFPYYPKLKEVALKYNAIGACVSGAGPSVLVFVDERTDVESLKREGSSVCEAYGYRARIRNHGHSCFLCEIVIRSQFHTTYEPEA